eukprot:scaffold1072_cov118-Isochrysis_galbana.AAC.3
MVCSVEPAPASLVCQKRGRLRGGEVVCGLLRWYTTPLQEAVRCHSAVCVEVLRLCSPTERLWQALPVSVDRKSVVTNWLARIAGAFCTGLELTMLPDAGSRGRFCADMSVGAVSAGPEAEEAGRASAGSTSMLIPKIAW